MAGIYIFCEFSAEKMWKNNQIYFKTCFEYFLKLYSKKYKILKQILFLVYRIKQQM